VPPAGGPYTLLSGRRSPQGADSRDPGLTDRLRAPESLSSLRGPARTAKLSRPPTTHAAGLTSSQTHAP
jgi:hypothetical protein